MFPVNAQNDDIRFEYRPVCLPGLDHRGLSIATDVNSLGNSAVRVKPPAEISGLDSFLNFQLSAQPASTAGSTVLRGFHMHGYADSDGLPAKQHLPGFSSPYPLLDTGWVDDFLQMEKLLQSKAPPPDDMMQRDAKSRPEEISLPSDLSKRAVFSQQYDAIDQSILSANETVSAEVSASVNKTSFKQDIIDYVKEKIYTKPEMLAKKYNKTLLTVRMNIRKQKVEDKTESLKKDFLPDVSGNFSDDQYNKLADKLLGDYYPSNNYKPSLKSFIQKLHLDADKFIQSVKKSSSAEREKQLKNKLSLFQQKLEKDIPDIRHRARASVLARFWEKNRSKFKLLRGERSDIARYNLVDVNQFYNVISSKKIHNKSRPVSFSMRAMQKKLESEIPDPGVRHKPFIAAKFWEVNENANIFSRGDKIWFCQHNKLDYDTFCWALRYHKQRPSPKGKSVHMGKLAKKNLITLV